MFLSCWKIRSEILFTVLGGYFLETNSWIFICQSIARIGFMISLLLLANVIQRTNLLLKQAIYICVGSKKDVLDFVNLGGCYYSILNCTVIRTVNFIPVLLAWQQTPINKNTFDALSVRIENKLLGSKQIFPLFASCSNQFPSTERKDYLLKLTYAYNPHYISSVTFYLIST